MGDIYKRDEEELSMNYLLVRTYFNCKTKIHNFLHNEKGASEVIATVIILAIVVTIALLFSKNIQNLFGDLWTWVTTGTAGTKSGLNVDR